MAGNVARCWTTAVAKDGDEDDRGFIKILLGSGFFIVKTCLLLPPEKNDTKWGLKF